LDHGQDGVDATKNFQANYGFYGAQLQRNLLGGATGAWAAAARVSFVSLFGRRISTSRFMVPSCWRAGE
jgi:hypothetical protein